MNKQLVSALLASSALASLGGCSEGDQATIIIEAPAADSPAPAPAPAPEEILYKIRVTDLTCPLALNQGL